MSEWLLENLDFILPPFFSAYLKSKSEKKKRPHWCTNTREAVTWHYAHNDFTCKEFPNHLHHSSLNPLDCTVTSSVGRYWGYSAGITIRGARSKEILSQLPDHVCVTSSVWQCGSKGKAGWLETRTDSHWWNRCFLSFSCYKPKTIKRNCRDLALSLSKQIVVWDKQRRARLRKTPKVARGQEVAEGVPALTAVPTSVYQSETKMEEVSARRYGRNARAITRQHFKQ